MVLRISKTGVVNGYLHSKTRIEILKWISYMIVILFLSMLTNMVQAQATELALADLNGDNGFIINGMIENDFTGYSVSNAGDINNDGIEDIIIGSPNTTPERSFVLFGDQNFDNAFIDFSSLDGNNGFIIYGPPIYSRLGESVANAGDVNGDGIDDLLIGAPRANVDGDFYVGQTYVVFGANNWSIDSLNLSDLDGSNGFTINGIEAYDESGSEVSGAGDVNGDGFNDILIGAQEANPDGFYSRGEAYIVFGNNSGFTQFLNLEDLDGNNGFLIMPTSELNSMGVAVSNAGDVNGDGIDDIILGANSANSIQFYNVGESYVIFGKNTPFSSTFEIANIDGTNGFVILGENELQYAGSYVSNAGDINADGVDDLLIGTSVSAYDLGECYIVYGKTGPFDALLEVADLDGTNGFTIINISSNSLSAAGDFNGDGIDDITISNSYGDYNGLFANGFTYAIYGKDSPFNSTIDILNLNTTEGLLIYGIDEDDRSGTSVSTAGDFNNDGLDDLIIGASHADPNGLIQAGESYVVYGYSNVQDSMPPVCLAQDITVFLNKDGIAIISAEDIDNGSYDDVAVDSMYLNIISFDYSNVGDNMVNLTVIDVNGNSSVCTGTVSVFSPMSSIEINSIELKISPNPASNYFYISIESNENVEFISLSNSEGKTVLKKKIKTSGRIETTLDIRSLSSGIYFIKVISEEGEFVKKVIKY